MVLQAIAAVPQPFEKSAEVFRGTVQLQPLSDALIGVNPKNTP